MGLFSPGGVHSHEQHLFALLDLCIQQKFTTVYLHLFLDGRDTPPQSALSSLERLESYLKTHPVATIASISGRYYAMDRDNRWDRIEQVYSVLTQSESKYHFADAETAIKSYYRENLSDEFIPPTQIAKPHSIKDGDAVLFLIFVQIEPANSLGLFLILNLKSLTEQLSPNYPILSV